jgi:hypothetical protein
MLYDVNLLIYCYVRVLCCMMYTYFYIVMLDQLNYSECMHYPIITCYLQCIRLHNICIRPVSNYPYPVPNLIEIH